MKNSVVTLGTVYAAGTGIFGVVFGILFFLLTLGSPSFKTTAGFILLGICPLGASYYFYREVVCAKRMIASADSANELRELAEKHSGQLTASDIQSHFDLRSADKAIDVMADVALVYPNQFTFDVLDEGAVLRHEGIIGEVLEVPDITENLVKKRRFSKLTKGGK